MASSYDHYPAWIVFVCNLLSFAIYALGALIVAGLGLWTMVAYLGFCIWMEIRLLRNSCANCAYYGHRCGTGRGGLAKLLFRRGDPAVFAARSVTWSEMIPDMLVLVIPLITGVYLSVRTFSWWRLLAVAAIIALSTAGNATVRGNLLCSHCRQREIGCPASRLFEQSG
jgi:hypothetical protein